MMMTRTKKRRGRGPARRTGGRQRTRRVAAARAPRAATQRVRPRTDFRLARRAAGSCESGRVVRARVLDQTISRAVAADGVECTGEHKYAPKPRLGISRPARNDGLGWLAAAGIGAGSDVHKLPCTVRQLQYDRS